MDTLIWKRMRIAALKRGISATKWVTEAIRTKLRKEEG